MAFASGKVGRDVQPSVTFALCGAQRTPSKLGGSPPPRERVEATRSRSRRVARGRITTCYMDAARSSTISKPGGRSRRAMRHLARGITAAAADVRCTAQRRAWQFLATHQPPHHPPSFILSSPPRHATSAARSSAARAYTRRPGNRTPPRATRGRLSAHGPLGRTRTRSSSRNDEPACFGSGASSGDECVSLVPVAHADALM